MKAYLKNFQSSYKSHYSTETVLVKVQNDILKAIDNNRSVILLLLDLSAAFDTVDHSILLSRLQNRFGIRNIALKWFHSYLYSREGLFLLMELNRRRSIYSAGYHRVLC